MCLRRDAFMAEWLERVPLRSIPQLGNASRVFFLISLLPTFMPFY